MEERYQDLGADKRFSNVGRAFFALIASAYLLRWITPKWKFSANHQKGIQPSAQAIRGLRF
jgi:hypothetical protein